MSSAAWNQTRMYPRYRRAQPGVAESENRFARAGRRSWSIAFYRLQAESFGGRCDGKFGAPCEKGQRD